MTLPKHFICFLKKEKCYTTYLKYILTPQSRRTRLSWGHPADIVDFFKMYKNDPKRWILSTFSWSATLEGYNYWDAIYEKWMELLFNNKNEIYDKQTKINDFY